MGGACLRDHGHPWPAGGAGGAPASGWTQRERPRRPNAVDAAAVDLFPGAVAHGDRLHQRQPEGLELGYGEPNHDAIRHPERHRDQQRLEHSLPIAQPDRVRFPDAERIGEPEGVSLA